MKGAESKILYGSALSNKLRIADCYSQEGRYEKEIKLYDEVLVSDGNDSCAKISKAADLNNQVLKLLSDAKNQQFLAQTLQAEYNSCSGKEGALRAQLHANNDGSGLKLA